MGESRHDKLAQRNWTFREVRERYRYERDDREKDLKSESSGEESGHEGSRKRPKTGVAQRASKRRR